MSVFDGTPSLTLENLAEELAKPKEQIEKSPFQIELEAEEKAEESVKEEQAQAEAFDREQAELLNYNEGQYLTAKFMLVQLDRILAFGFSMLSGKEMDNYRLRRDEIKGKDYEAELLAALVKKYQMGLSLEAMFVTAIVMAYAPMYQRAMRDRKAELVKQMEEEQRAFVQWQTERANAQSGSRFTQTESRA